MTQQAALDNLLRVVEETLEIRLTNATDGYVNAGLAPDFARQKAREVVGESNLARALREYREAAK